MMITNAQTVLRIVAGLGFALALAACGRSSSHGSTTISPGAPATAQEDQFGAAFGTDFRAAANSEPAVVNSGDIVPVSATTEPVTIK